MATRRVRPVPLALLLAALAAVGVLAFSPQTRAVPDGLLIFSQVAVPDSGEPDWRFPERARLVAVDLSDPEAEPTVLTPDFAAARAPTVHFDGRRVVFAGRRRADGPWQIWEMELPRGEPELLVPSCERCTDPVYRPDDGVVFVAPVADGGRMAVHTVGRGGGDPVRITHHLYSDAALGLVSDGRVMVATGAASADRQATEYWALRHDGTGAELMYRGEDGSRVIGPAHETTDRDLVFVERGGGRARVVAISQAYPGTSRRELVTPPGQLHSVFPAPDGSLIASYRPGTQSVYGLWRMDAEDPAERLIGPGSSHAVEPVLAVSRGRPLGFVSATDPAAGSGTFFGLDARLTGLGEIDTAAAVLRIRTPEGELGRVPLAPDGSFHLELPPDTPLQLETLDRAGNLVRGPSAWIWVRPGELSGCVGCHESRALAPGNRLPMAAAQSPVSFVDAGGPGPAGEGGP